MNAVTDALDALRVEIQAAITFIVPQIRGLNDLTKTSISADTLVAVQTEVATRQRRKDRLDAVIVALDRLEAVLAALFADGYPAIVKATVSDEIAAELSEQGQDINAAIEQFLRAIEAANIVINLGAPVPKTTP